MNVKSLVSKRKYSLVTVGEAGPKGDAMFKGSAVEAVSLEHALEKFRISGEIVCSNGELEFPKNCKRFISPLDIKFLDDLNDEVGVFRVTWSSIRYDNQIVEVWYIVPEGLVVKFSELSGIPLI